MSKDGLVAEFSRFRAFYGGSGKDRKYGPGETSGRFINLPGSRFFKKTGEPYKKKSGSTTRDAFQLTIDNEAANKSERDDRVIGTLPKKIATVFRVKDIKYGNNNAMWEVLSSQLYALTGLGVPDNRLLIYSERETRENGAPKVFVASPLANGYFDLGQFLTDDNMLRFIEESNQESWRLLKNRVKEIDEQEVITDLDKKERNSLYEELYKMLPDYFHQEIQKAFAASKFIGNWDFANLNLSNIGVKFTLDSQGNVIGLRAIFVDFGNSGVIGFRGKYKEASLDIANTEAKTKAASPNDYDPQLIFSSQETDLLKSVLREIKENPEDLDSKDYKVRSRAINKAVEFLEEESEFPDVISPTIFVGEYLDELSKIGEKKLMRDLLGSILFKCSHHIMPSEAKMEIDKRTTGFLTMSDLPRNLPFGAILRSVIEKKTWRVGDGQNIYENSEIEVAFRLSLISDQAIEAIAQKWFLSEEFPNIFPVPEDFKKDPKYNSVAGVAEIFKQRKKDLISLIPEEVVNEWARNNPIIAVAAEQEVRLAIASRTRIPNQDFDFDTNTPKTPQAAAEVIDIDHKLSFRSRVRNIDISPQIQVLAKIKRNIEDYREKLEGKPNKGNEHRIEDQKILQEMINFIERNSESWKRSLGIPHNCTLFNIKMIKRHFPVLREPTAGKYISEGEREVFNRSSYESNSAVYRQFMESLEKVTSLVPSHEVKASETSTRLLQNARQCD